MFRFGILDFSLLPVYFLSYFDIRGVICYNDCHDGLIKQGVVRVMEEMRAIEKYYKTPSYGFTLAEVLITLGIIGVVAALTIPTLLSNYKAKETATKLAKAKSILTNGFKLMMAKNGVYSVDGLPAARCGDDEGCYSAEFSQVFKILSDNSSGLDPATLPEKYVVSEENLTSLIPAAYAADESESEFNWSDVPFIFQLADGEIYGLEFVDDTKSFDVYLDLNGATNPNRVADDMYKFRVIGNAMVADVTSELAESTGCSANNLEACETAEQCYAAANALKDDSGACPQSFFSETSGCNILVNGYWSYIYCH